jgi:hypothetical protein
MSHCSASYRCGFMQLACMNMQFEMRRLWDLRAEVRNNVTPIPGEQTFQLVTVLYPLQTVCLMEVNFVRHGRLYTLRSIIAYVPHKIR